MDKEQWSELASLLQVGHLPFDPGLTDEEVERTEKNFGFRFPPDLRAFLQTVMPAHIGFYDWRDGDETWLRSCLQSPLRQWLDYLDHGKDDTFWFAEWGTKPTSLLDARDIVRAKIAEAPKLIPIYNGAYIPEEPHEAGNPVFSFSQMELDYAGFDLDDYIRSAFNLPGQKVWPSHIRPIRFWNVDRFQKLNWGE